MLCVKLSLLILRNMPTFFHIMIKKNTNLKSSNIKNSFHNDLSYYRSIINNHVYLSTTPYPA